MNFEFERVFFEAKYSHRIFLNKFTKNFHNFFWIYGVFIYFCFEMKMFLFLQNQFQEYGGGDVVWKSARPLFEMLFLQSFYI